MTRKPQSLLAVAFCGFAIAAAPFSMTVHAAENPVAAEKNPPGDIPDSQVFIVYTSPLGFSIKVPEGWARRDKPDGAVFFDKYNTIELSSAPATEKLAKASVLLNQAAELVRNGRAIRIKTVKEVTLPSGPAVEILYTSNSDLNSVTNKQIRQENDRYLLSNNGKIVTIDLAAPLGADNVDQWKLISESFRWQ